MKIMGEKGLGNFIKVFLQFCMVIGIIVGIVLPFILSKYEVDLKLAIIVVYPNCLFLALITNNFIKLFDSLKMNNPFCEKNVEILSYTGIISLIQSVCWAFDFIILCILSEKFNVSNSIVIIFLFVLFFGVSIALFILAELFEKATDYKKENDLTI